MAEKLKITEKKVKLLLSDLAKARSNVGEAVGGSYIKRVVTGTDKDGSPQYRYIRSKDELEAYEKQQRAKKKNADKKKDADQESIQEKLEGEHKRSRTKAKGTDPSVFLKSSPKNKLYLKS